ncbi:MAG: hypothetical protein A2452_04670 [Candidatus Firestonebacteria bacterium RIFOXYC2_FULL_39_67]|nr:MAG: hypothetical protein A2536_11640 [Candidatus Firestonebacteria bacterium RIFOXYD2_FULL_39_29]OGF55880.1 MAG: hypothetical protein A2452_04670 [Candidatus Firestonebacteria bacterium RIFOXYC2_FULL_39_67]
MSGFRNIISSVRSFLKEHMWSFMLFLLIGFLFIIIVQQPGRQLFGHDVALQGDGIPFMEDVISKGRLPYWNPYINAGMPHMASMNANIVFFPTTLIILLLGLPVHLYFLYDCFTGIVLAGIFMYLFIRGMNFSKLTSCISGVFFIACGSFFSYINPGHAVIMIALAFLPIIFYFIKKGVEENKFIYYLLAGFMLGLQSLVCMYQVTFYTAACMTAYFLFLFITEKKKPKHLLYYFATAVTTVFAAAIQLFQSYYFLKFTFRAGVNYEFFTSWSFHPLETIVYIYPKFFGFLESTYWGKSQFWLHNDYLGIIPWIFVFAAIYFVFKDKRVKFFLFMAISTLILAFGGFTPLYKLLFKIPVINGFRNSTRWLGFFAFSIITLAAFGFEYIKEYFKVKKEEQNSNKMRVFFRVLMVILIVFLSVYILFSSNQSSMVNDLKGLEQFNKRFPPPNLDYVAQILYQMIKDDMFLFVVYFSIGMSLIYLMVKGKLGKGLFFAGCLLMVFLDNGIRFMAPRTFNVAGSEYKVQCVKTEPANQEDPRKTDIHNFLKNDNSLYRVMPVGDLFTKNWFVSEKIQSCGGYHSAPLENYTIVQNKGLLNDFRFLSLLNVKYVISDNQIAHPYLRLVNDGKVKIHQNISILPRAFLYSQAVVLEKEKMFAKMLEQSFEPQKAIMLNESIPETLDNVKYDGKEAVITKYEENKIDLEVESSGNSMLFISEVYYPEWKAYVDGKETKIYQAFGLFRSIYLPKGKHNVEFRWDAKIFYIGASVSLFIAFLIIFYGSLLLKKEKREEKGS